MDTNTGQTILVIGDESRERDALTDLLKAEGYQLLTATTCEQALDTARKRKPAIALIDLWLADLPGHVVLHGVRQASPETECIAMLTNPAQQDGAYEALALGAFTFLRRAYDAKQLLSVIRRAVEKRDIARALDDVKQRLATLFDTLPVGVLIVDERTGAVVDANPAAVRYMGAPKAEIVGAILQSRAIGSSNADAPAAGAPAGSNAPAPPPDAAAALRQTGRRIPATRTVAAIMIGARRHRVECFVDVSGRLDVEDRFAAADTLNRVLLEDVKDQVFAVDRHGVILRVFQTPPARAGAEAHDSETESARRIPATCRDRYRQALNDVFRSGHGNAFSAGTPPFEAWSVRIDPVQSRGETLAAIVRLRDLSALARATQRQQFRDSAVAHSAEALLVVNTEGTIEDANEAAAQLLEYQTVELIGMGFQQLDHPEQPRPWARMWSAAAAQGHAEFPSRHRTRGGDLRAVTLTLHHITHDGTALVLVFVRDTATAERAANALADVAARERAVLDAFDEPAWIVDRTGTVRSANEAAARLVNRPVDELAGKAFAQLLPQALAETRRRRVEDTFVRGQVVTFEDHAGGRRHLVRMGPVRDHGGTVVAVMAVARDVTQSRAEQAQLSQRWLHGQEALLELDLDGLLPLAPAGAQEAELDAYLQAEPGRIGAVLDGVVIAAASPAAATLLRAPADQLVRNGLKALVPDAAARPLADALLRSAAGRAAVTALEIALTGADGNVVPVTARLAVRADADGRPRYAVLGLLDRSAQVAARSDMLDTSAREQARLGAELQTAAVAPAVAAADAAWRLRTALAEREPALAAEAEALATKLNDLQGRVARIAQDLASESGGDMGLLAAMGRLADAATARWGVACRCNLRTAGLSTDRALGNHLQGIAREAVDHAVRQRGARQLSITLTATPREGLLTIKDDGTAPAPGAPEDLAQRLMRIHTELIHGELAMERDPRGTNTLTCRFPNA